MKPDVKRRPNKDLPLCALHHDCHSNKAGQCTALSSTGWVNGKCPFYKTRKKFLEGCRISLIRLLKRGRTDLLAKYGCMEAYAKALNKVASASGGGPDETV